jgi:NADP-dependent alcohol dehydrogenase
MQDQRDPKREKLLQYAANVWNIREGDDDARIDAAIEATRTFFHTMDIDTRLSDYGLGASDIDLIVAALESHGMTALGEHQAITPDAARRILNAAL